MDEIKEPEFLARILDPDNYPYIDNEDGTISTHKMAAEVDEEGNWFVFPTIVQLPTGELYDFKSNAKAMEYNLKNNNYLPMKTKKEALDYAKGGYKLGSKLEKMNIK
tara:strand:+ start:2130 stop:2450 length:321 start_codon:yes stop_codon:yes gene_type:complete